MNARARLKSKRIGVLYGGWSAERPISLRSGRAVLAAVRRLGLNAVPVDVTRRAPEQLRRARLDLAFLTLHGPFGEDGTVQALLEILGVPYTGSGVRSSATAMHKPSSKRVFEAAGLPTPAWRTVDPSSPSSIVSFPRPWVIKPASQGSAIGVTILRRLSEWKGALRKAARFGREIVVEKFIEGTEITVAVLGRRALPVIEIVPKHEFYDFYSKYAPGGSAHLVPARLPAAVTRRAGETALAAFRALDCRHFGRVDLMVPKDGRPTLLEVNTLPGMTDVSLFPDAARAAGMSFDDLILEILSLAAKDGR